QRLVSVFDPHLTDLHYRWYCPPGGRILDPFAGGATRGLVAAARGYHYTGIDLSGRQVEANRAQDRKSTRLNSSHVKISYAVFCWLSHLALRSFPTRRSSDLSGSCPCLTRT